MYDFFVLPLLLKWITRKQALEFLGSEETPIEDVRHANTSNEWLTSRASKSEMNLSTAEDYERNFSARKYAQAISYGKSCTVFWVMGFPLLYSRAEVDRRLRTSLENWWPESGSKWFFIFKISLEIRGKQVPWTTSLIKTVSNHELVFFCNSNAPIH